MCSSDLGVIPERALDQIYSPLGWFLEHTATKNAMGAYVDAWLRLTNTHIYFPK